MAENKQQEAFQPSISSSYAYAAEPPPKSLALDAPLSYKTTNSGRTDVTVMRLGYMEQEEIKTFLPPVYDFKQSVPLDTVLCPYHRNLEPVHINQARIRASIVAEGLQVLLMRVNFCAGDLLSRRKDMVPYHAVYSRAPHLDAGNVEVAGCRWPVTSLDLDAGIFLHNTVEKHYNRVMKYADFRAEQIAIKADKLITAHSDQSNPWLNFEADGMNVQCVDISVGSLVKGAFDNLIRLQPPTYQIRYDQDDYGRASMISAYRDEASIQFTQG